MIAFGSYRMKNNPNPQFPPRLFPLGLRRLLPPPPKQVLKTLHPLLIKPIRHVPFDIQRKAMETLMRQSFAEAIEFGELDFLISKWLKIEVMDLGLVWYITQGSVGPVVAAGPLNADVSICGNLKEFVSLANQLEDPDTLFFQRRLMIEGDTELGLAVKNVMFSAELEGVPQRLSQLLQRYMDTVQP